MSLGTLKSLLQVTNDTQPLSLTLHAVNELFIHPPPPNAGNYSILHNSVINIKNIEVHFVEFIFTP